MKAGAPCYLWWPKDALADPRVTILTLEEEGAYRRLLDWCWIEGSVPAAPDELGMLVKCDTSTSEGLEKATRIANRLRPFFAESRGGDRWTHHRLEAERAEQAEKRAKKQRAADARWNGSQQREGPAADPLGPRRTDRKGGGAHAS